MCEREPAKQKYLSQAFPGIPLFEDMQELGNGSATEYRTGNLQEVPKAFPVGCLPNGPSSGVFTNCYLVIVQCVFFRFWCFHVEAEFAAGGHPADWLSVQIDLSSEQQCQELPGWKQFIRRWVCKLDEVCWCFSASSGCCGECQEHGEQACQVWRRGPDWDPEQSLRTQRVPGLPQDGQLNKLWAPPVANQDLGHLQEENALWRSQLWCCSPPARWGLLDFIRAVVLLLLRLLLQFLLDHVCLHFHVHCCLAQLLAKLFANFGAQCALLDLNLGPSQLSAHRWTSTWDLPSSVRTAGPQPGTFPAQCAPLDLNLGPSQLSAHRWTSTAR